MPYHRPMTRHRLKSMLLLLIEIARLQINVRPQFLHYLLKHRGGQRLRAIRPGLLRARVYFDDQTIRAHRDTGSMIVRQQVVDCGTKSPTEVCLISYDSETSR